MRTLIIHNPFAGRGRNAALLNPFLDSGFNIMQTSGPGHATQIVHENSDHYDLFIVAGGDGTVNEIAKAVTGSDKTMGIIPMGSGNGLVNEVGKITADALKMGNYTITVIDTLYLNDIPFFNVAGTGFEALVAHDFSKSKNRGLLSYVAITISKFIRFKGDKVQYSIKDGSNANNIFSFTIANSKQYGNNAVISPNSVADDGLFEVCIIRKFPAIYGPVFSFRLFMGSLTKSRFYKSISTTSLALTNETSSLWHIDGDPLKIEGPVRVTIKPASLRLIRENQD